MKTHQASIERNILDQLWIDLKSIRSKHQSSQSSLADSISLPYTDPFDAFANYPTVFLGNDAIVVSNTHPDRLWNKFCEIFQLNIINMKKLRRHIL